MFPLQGDCQLLFFANVRSTELLTSKPTLELVTVEDGLPLVYKSNLFPFLTKLILDQVSVFIGLKVVVFPKAVWPVLKPSISTVEKGAEYP